jgi:hypothetical protein
VQPKGGESTRKNPFGQSFSAQFPCTSTPRISPGSHVTVTSNGRQHTSQSVVNRWLATLVSMATSDDCPQNGQEMDSQTSTRKFNRARAKRNSALDKFQKRKTIFKPPQWNEKNF